MYGVAAKSSQHFYYTCKRFYEMGKSTCDFGFINRQRLDRVVLEKVQDVLLEEGNLRQLAEEVNQELGDHEELIRSERQLVKRQLKEKESQVARLVDAIEQGEVPVTAIQPRLQARQQEAERLQGRLIQLEDYHRDNVRVYVDIDRIRPYVESLKETLATSSIKSQRAVLQSFVKQVEVDNTQLAIEFAIPQAPITQKEPHNEGLPEGVLCMVTSGTPGRPNLHGLP